VSRQLKLESIEIHPSFADGQITYDLAVLRLAPGEVNLDEIACLPRRPLYDYIMSPLQMSGYGADSQKRDRKKAPSELEFKSGGVQVKDIEVVANCSATKTNR
jgi:hypothetical protein